MSNMISQSYGKLQSCLLVLLVRLPLVFLVLDVVVVVVVVVVVLLLLLFLLLLLLLLLPPPPPPLCLSISFPACKLQISYFASCVLP